MQILIKKVDGVVVPTRGHDDDAAYDITATSEPNIVGIKYERLADGIKAWQKIDYIEYKTNLFIAPQDEDTLDGECLMVDSPERMRLYHTLVHARSSISKKNLVLANSVAIIDHGYRGELAIRFKYVFQPEDYVILPEVGRTRLYAIVNPENIYQKGDRIAQIKATPNIDIDFQVVESLDETKRGTGGFGSTNK
jgi:dUTPase